MYEPFDTSPHPRHKRSQPLELSRKDGNYVYAMDETGVIHVLPDGPHRHPRILGDARPVQYAGDLRIQDGIISDVTNLSGTFQCDDPEGLLKVAQELRRLGFTLAAGAVRFFPLDGSRPQLLQ